jgi:hypothetical protein
MAILCALLAHPTRAAGKDQPNADTSTLQEVVVTAGKPLGKRALQHAANTFTKSHATLNPRSGQISHWGNPVCPVTRGLQPHADDYVSHRIVAIAQEVGAPSSAARHCRVNVQIVFLRDPQAEVDRIAKISPTMLGYTNGSVKELATVRFPIQAWYVTATGGVVDSQFTLIVCHGCTHLIDVESQIEYEIVAVDESKVGEYSLDTISDYLAMLILTRTAQDGCNALPSIIDLLSPDCGSREKPQALTDADKAFLRGLYGTDFGMKINLEQGQINQQLVHALGR